jgi:hypothetical protein
MTIIESDLADLRIVFDIYMTIIESDLTFYDQFKYPNIIADL